MFGMVAGRRGRPGGLAEDAAAQWLRGRGLLILARNFRCRFGELDLVALDGDELVVVEVKSREGRVGRAGDDYGPAFRVTGPKRLRVLRAVTCYLARYGWPSGARGLRVDVLLATRVGGGDEAYAFEHLRNAL